MVLGGICPGCGRCEPQAGGDVPPPGLVLHRPARRCCAVFAISRFSPRSTAPGARRNPTSSAPRAFPARADPAPSTSARDRVRCCRDRWCFPRGSPPPPPPIRGDSTSARLSAGAGVRDRRAAAPGSRPRRVGDETVFERVTRWNAHRLGGDALAASIVGLCACSYSLRSLRRRLGLRAGGTRREPAARASFRTCHPRLLVTCTRTCHRALGHPRDRAQSWVRDGRGVRVRLVAFLRARGASGFRTPKSRRSRLLAAPSRSTSRARLVRHAGRDRDRRGRCGADRVRRPRFLVPGRVARAGGFSRVLARTGFLCARSAVLAQSFARERDGARAVQSCSRRPPSDRAAVILHVRCHLPGFDRAHHLSAVDAPSASRARSTPDPAGLSFHCARARTPRRPRRGTGLFLPCRSPHPAASLCFPDARPQATPRDWDMFAPAVRFSFRRDRHVIAAGQRGARCGSPPPQPSRSPPRSRLGLAGERAIACDARRDDRRPPRVERRQRRSAGTTSGRGADSDARSRPPRPAPATRSRRTRASPQRRWPRRAAGLSRSRLLALETRARPGKGTVDAARRDALASATTRRHVRASIPRACTGRRASTPSRWTVAAEDDANTRRIGRAGVLRMPGRFVPSCGSNQPAIRTRSQDPLCRDDRDPHAAGDLSGGISRRAASIACRRSREPFTSHTGSIPAFPADCSRDSTAVEFSNCPSLYGPPGAAWMATSAAPFAHQLCRPGSETGSSGCG